MKFTDSRPHVEVKESAEVLAAIAGVRAYGRSDYDFANRAVNVIGVRVGGQWKIFAQKLEKHNLAIRKVERLWPA